MTEVEQVIRWLLERNKTEADELADALANGSAPDYPRYTHACGQVHALNKLNAMLVDKLNQYMNGEGE